MGRSTILSTLSAGPRAACALGLGLALWLAVATPAAALYPCRGLPRVLPTVTTERGRVEEDTSLTINQITAISGGPSTISSHALGLSKSELSYSYEWMPQIQIDNTGRVCGSIARMTMTVRMTNRRVYIARELLGDRCAYNFVRAHEHKHVKVDDQALATLSAQLKQRLAQVVRANHQRKGRDASQLQAEMEADVKYQVDRLWNEVVGQRMRAQAKIDRPGGDYARINNVCRGVIPQLVARRL